MPRDGVRDGPFLRLPEGPFDGAVVSGMTESLGHVGAVLRTLAGRLLSGREILIDVENQLAPRALRLAVEGNPCTLEVSGSVRDPERPVLLRSLLEMLEAAGLLVTDCYGVPARPGSVSPELPRALLREGFLAIHWLDGAPPARLWLCARKVAARAGSVLVGPGSDEARDRTDAALASFLPGPWEIIRCPGDRELAAFNRGVCLSQGEVLWFVPAGAQPSGDVFLRLCEQSASAPAIPAAAEQTAGGLAGLMARRIDVLSAGPLPDHWDYPGVGWEDYGMRLEAMGRGPVVVAGDLGPVPDADAAVGTETMRREVTALSAKWEGLDAYPRSGSAPSTPTEPGEAPPWTGREPKVSLCMIARDEEAFLRGCLESVAPVVDEIVIVDTGSTDSTVTIAEEFGARVLHAVWDDDFSAPRNVGLEAATGDWILVLDADERLTPDARERLRELVRHSEISGYHVVMRNVYDGGKTQGVRMVRLFRRLAGVAYVNRIHEQVTPSLAAAAARDGLALSSSDLLIEHLGYSTEVIQARGKDDRNERLFLRHMAEQPDDIYMLYKYGDFLRRLPGRSEDSLRYLERALELVYELSPGDQHALPYAGEIAALCVLEYARQDAYEQADEIAERAFRSFLATPNLHYITAGVALRLGRPDEAIAHYRRCMSWADQVLVVPIQEGVTSWVALTGMAQAWIEKGETGRAMRLLEQSRAVRPSYEVTALAASRLHLERDDAAAALQVLTDFLADYPDSPGACQQATHILARLGLVPQARKMGERAVVLLERANLEAEAERVRDALAALT